MKRICVFTKPLDNWRSGSGHHVNEILTRLLDLNAKGGGFDFTFAHYGPSPNPIYSRVKEIIVSRNPLSSATVMRSLAFDLIHFTQLTIYSPIWFNGARRMTATMHGADELQTAAVQSAVKLAHERWVVPFFARKMDGVFTVSETSKKYFVDEFGLDASRICVGYNGLSGTYRVLPEAETLAPRKLGIPGPYILHVSRFSERKNPWKLLEAFARFKDASSTVDRSAKGYSLVCAGYGWDGAAVRREAARLGFADRFFCPGFTEERIIVELMNGARCFLFPSLAEGFGMPNVEAMACGCPVVTTAVSAIPEIVGDGALLVHDPTDAASLASALRIACFDEGARAELKRRSARRLRLFDWDESARRLLDFFDRALVSASHPVNLDEAINAFPSRNSA
ncbi:MAG: hypothetical protein A2Z99_20770 [Treponema sp. GWB1_62_6]|nr:MAG: hypothetical protein A2Z99_20770 [Treponema sp. GWB1_62_6]